MSQLSGMIADTKAEWTSLPKSERTTAKKTELGNALVSSVYALEGVADANVQSILDDGRARLEAIGEDPSVLDVLWDYYLDDKASEKAYYISQYLG